MSKINKNDTVVDETFLGREKSLLDKEIEMKGVKDMFDDLTQEECDQLPDRRVLVRHFRAEKGNTQLALEKLRAALAWRKEFDVASIIKAAEYMSSAKSATDDPDPKIIELAETLKVEDATGKIYTRGYDKDGRALLMLKPAKENTKEMMNQMRNLVYNLERSIACTSKKSSQIIAEENKSNGDATDGVDGPLDKINIVIDYTGFRVSHSPPISTTRYTLDILQKHYPERLLRCYVMNPPLYFRTFMAIIKPFMDPITKQKVVLCPMTPKGLGPFHEAVGEKNLSKLEEFAGGISPVKPFSADEYFATPFDFTFDEEF